MTNNKWNADAEMSMMGFTVAIESEEHLSHLVKYVLNTVKGEYHYDLEEKTKEVVENATRKYRSGKDKSIQWFTVNSTAFGLCLTFVRDKGSATKKNGVLAWVENIDYPDCSELGYTYFEDSKGKVRRIA